KCDLVCDAHLRCFAGNGLYLAAKFSPGTVENEHLVSSSQAQYFAQVLRFVRIQSYGRAIGSEGFGRCIESASSHIRVVSEARPSGRATLVNRPSLTVGLLTQSCLNYYSNPLAVLIDFKIDDGQFEEARLNHFQLRIQYPRKHQSPAGRTE